MTCKLPQHPLHCPPLHVSPATHSYRAPAWSSVLCSACHVTLPTHPPLTNAPVHTPTRSVLTCFSTSWPACLVLLLIQQCLLPWLRWQMYHPAAAQSSGWHSVPTSTCKPRRLNARTAYSTRTAHITSQYMHTSHKLAQPDRLSVQSSRLHLLACTRQRQPATAEEQALYGHVNSALPLCVLGLLVGA